MDEPVDIYGANLPIFEKLKLLAEWAPMIGRLQVVLDAKSPGEQAVAIVSAMRWAAGKSATELDDEALFHLEALLRSSEGQAFFQWVVSKVQSA
jgi:hypothetical protein